MESQSDRSKRRGPDRRRRPTSPWAAFRPGGRRTAQRRLEEHAQVYFVDRYTTPLLVWILVLLMLTLADGIITLHLLDVDCQEVNPVMSYLIGRGHSAFLFGKYLMTA